MKIKISPSLIEPDYLAVEIDTLTNDDAASSCVEACMKALVASGHDESNVAEACAEWAEVAKAMGLQRYKAETI